MFEPVTITSIGYSARLARRLWRRRDVLRERGKDWRKEARDDRETLSGWRASSWRARCSAAHEFAGDTPATTGSLECLQLR